MQVGLELCALHFRAECQLVDADVLFLHDFVQIDVNLSVFNIFHVCHTKGLGGSFLKERLPGHGRMPVDILIMTDKADRVKDAFGFSFLFDCHSW